MEQGYGGSDNMVLRRAAKAAQRYNKETTREALRLMKDQMGITGTIEDLNYKELEMFMTYADYVEGIQKEVGSI
jgi:hypothetical protein